MAKKYYWLKLKNDFFNSKEIKKLRRTTGGDTFVIIYLKMQLLSLQNNGKIYFDGIEEDFASEIALTLDEDLDNVKLTMAFLQNCGLIECDKVNECFLTQVPEVTGKECDSAQRVRDHRTKKALQCNNDVTKCNTEIEIDIDIEKDKDILSDKSDCTPKPPKSKKHKFGEYGHVRLANEEYQRLCEDYGTETADLYIKKCDEYCESKPAVYGNYNLTIRNWLNRDNIKKRSDSNESVFRSPDPSDAPF